MNVTKTVTAITMLIAQIKTDLMIATASPVTEEMGGVHVMVSDNIAVRVRDRTKLIAIIATL